MAQTSFGPMEGLGAQETRLEAAAPYVAEFVGTFMLVFTVGTCCVAGDPVWNWTTIAAILMVAIYGLGPVSGGHFNPAVSVACGIARKTPWARVFGYILVQVAAGLLAGWAYWVTFDRAAGVGPKHDYGWFHAGVAEIVYTAMLGFAHLNCATSLRNNPQDDQNHFFGLAIGFVLVAGGYAAGDVSGASLNPAVTLGLDVTGAGGTDKEGWYWRVAYIGYELLGAGLAVLCFHVCRFKEVGDFLGRGGAQCLKVQILAARNLINSDTGAFGGLSDPYVTARVGPVESRTSTINNSLNPVWTSDNLLTFELEGSALNVLTLEVMNANTFLKDKSLGTLTVDISSLPVNELQQRRERLLGGRNGELEFSLHLSDSLVESEPAFVSKLFGEFIGTFLLVLTVGLNIVTKSPATAWSAAAALMTMIYSLGNVSGGHFNPAVTVAAVSTGRGVCRPLVGLAYILVQLLAGVFAGLLNADFHEAGPYKSERLTLGPGVSQQVPGTMYSWSALFFAEFAFTFMLAFVVLAVATTKAPLSITKQQFQYALAIGSCVTAGGFAIGAISGGALNPAVAWGVATASSGNPDTNPAPPAWSNCLWFSIFEFVGGIFAAVVFCATHAREYRKAAEVGS